MAGYKLVDLDATLAFFPPPVGQEIGPPVPKMLARVKRWLAAGEEVRILTARVGYSGSAGAIGRELEEIGRQRDLIEDWCQQHVGQKLKVQSHKCYGAAEIWDDRAVQVVANSGERVDGCG